MKTCPSCGETYPDEASFCSRDRTPLASVPATADLVGRVVAQRYRVLRLLGEGGMGKVYLAEHVMIGRRSALKVLSPEQLADRDARERFNREASNAARISHPNVCAIYDFGPTGEGPFYLAMEYVEGRTLKELLTNEGALSLVRAARLLDQCADGLEAAHALGIVHRDLKPDNIMVVSGPPETVKIVDFGIAKAVGVEPRQQVTRTGFIVGTPEYMSPEQLSGDTVDARSDVYALGLVMYRCLTGIHPFQAGTAQETLAKRLTDDPPPLAASRPDLRYPPELQEVLDRALARWPRDRYASAVEFSRGFRYALGSAPELLEPPPTRVLEDERTRAMARTIPPTRVEGEEARRPVGIGPLITAWVLAMLLGSAVYAFRGPLFGLGPAQRPPENITTTLDTAAAGEDTAAEVQPYRRPISPPIEPGATVPEETGGAGLDTAIRTLPPGPGLAALVEELERLQDSVLTDPPPSDPTPFRRRAEEIYGVDEYPDSIRLRAALTVAHMFIATSRSDDAKHWLELSLPLVAPEDDAQRINIRGLIARLESQPN